jgi:hypothetical protein
MNNLSNLRSRAFERTRRSVHSARFLALSASFAAANAMADGGVGGGSGTGDAVQARVSSTVSTAQIILYSVGALIMGGAALYTTYGIAWGGKKWSELGNVAGAMAAGGMAVMLAGWLFS